MSNEERIEKIMKAWMEADDSKKDYEVRNKYRERDNEDEYEMERLFKGNCRIEQLG